MTTRAERALREKARRERKQKMLQRTRKKKDPDQAPGARSTEKAVVVVHRQLGVVLGLDYLPDALLALKAMLHCTQLVAGHTMTSLIGSGRQVGCFGEALSRFN